ncbi:hypothetical protein HT574_14990 [Parageobacillus sp. VR-IP]|uniref:hypothetical protein n=1 Tax=Parageobacillus sp. VR-IP TaxID=2742205 RepID=UPI00158329DF|nr:hypothetical protein [Parageobacillus sp. VR-IP]NUK31348.1 hypothetical protein [Parageobacillus sp. VR-IP]
MGIHHGKREKPIVVYASHLPKGMIKEIECCFDQGLYLAVMHEDGQKATAYKPGSSVGVDLGEVHTIGALVKMDKPSLSREEKYAPFTDCGIKNWRRFSGANRNIKKDHADGKSISGRNNTCYRNPKDSCGMRSIKRRNSLSTGV